MKTIVDISVKATESENINVKATESGDINVKATESGDINVKAYIDGVWIKLSKMFFTYPIYKEILYMLAK